MPTETGCNPPSCLVIPPASAGCFSVVGYTQGPNCTGLEFDYPFDPTVPIPPGPSFAPFLCRTWWGFRLASGTCAQILVQNSTAAGLPTSGSTVTCPPGFTYDPIHEVCILDGVLIIWPGDLFPPPPPPPPPSTGCVPNCTDAGGRSGRLANLCFEACIAIGGIFSPGTCEKACCIPCGPIDPPIPRGRHDMISGRLRAKFDFGRPPFELRHALIPASVAENSLGKFRLRNPAHQSHKPLGGG